MFTFVPIFRTFTASGERFVGARKATSYKYLHEVLLNFETTYIKSCSIPLQQVICDITRARKLTRLHYQFRINKPNVNVQI